MNKFLIVFLTLIVLAGIYRLYMWLVGLTVDDVKNGHILMKPSEGKPEDNAGEIPGDA